MFGEFQIFDFRFASLVLNDEMIDGAEIYREGVYACFGPHRSHRPRTETSLRLFGVDVLQAQSR